MQPFLADNHFINVLFPPRIYAVIIPAAAGVLLLAAILIFFGMVSLSQNRKKKIS